MATELLRRLGHARGRALSAAVDTAFCLHVYRDFTGGVGRCCLRETHPQRWLGPSLHAGMGYASAANNMATSSKVCLCVHIRAWVVWSVLRSPLCPESGCFNTGLVHCRFRGRSCHKLSNAASTPHSFSAVATPPKVLLPKIGSGAASASWSGVGGQHLAATSDCNI